jgi:branched-chain amino acid transport system substrate-binding protein
MRISDGIRCAVIASCLAAFPALAQGPMQVRIGHAAPLTGGLAHLGKDNENGARLALEEANAARLTIGGRQVEFVLLAEDDRADAKTGVSVAEKFVEAKVSGVVGHLNSGTSIPAAQVYARAGIPVITGSAANPRLTELGLRTQFRIIGRDDRLGEALALYLLRERRPRVVVVIDDSTPYGEGLANEVEHVLRAGGARVVPRLRGTNQTVDWRADLAKAKLANPDLVFYGGMDATAGPLLRQAREAGMQAVFAFGDGACINEMTKLAGPAAEGMLCAQTGIPVAAADARFRDAFQRRFGAAPILYAAYTYDAVLALIVAMRTADSVDPAVYMPALAAVETKGATGAIVFDAKGDRRHAEVTILSVRGGALQPIATARPTR